jgi:hypothetical protein
MEVDSVTVWELSSTANCANSASHLNITNQAGFNGYDHKVRYSVKVNPTFADAITVPNDVTFRASNYIEINKNFTVDTGESATFLIHGCP